MERIYYSERRGLRKMKIKITKRKLGLIFFAAGLIFIGLGIYFYGCTKLELAGALLIVGGVSSLLTSFSLGAELMCRRSEIIK